MTKPWCLSLHPNNQAIGQSGPLFKLYYILILWRLFWNLRFIYVGAACFQQDKMNHSYNIYNIYIYIYNIHTQTHTHIYIYIHRMKYIYIYAIYDIYCIHAYICIYIYGRNYIHRPIVSQVELSQPRLEDQGEPSALPLPRRRASTPWGIERASRQRRRCGGFSQRPQAFCGKTTWMGLVNRSSTRPRFQATSLLHILTISYNIWAGGWDYFWATLDNLRLKSWIFIDASGFFLSHLRDPEGLNSTGS